MYTSNWMRDLQQKSFAPFGIKAQHYNILRIVKGRKGNPVSAGEIKDVMLDKSPDLTRLIDKLVDMNLLDRQLCPENRRKMDITITENGLEFIEKINNASKSMFQDWKKRLSNDEAEKLSLLLDKVRG